MPSTYIDPFDFKKIFMEYFLGSQQLFVFAIIMLISFVSAMYGLSNRNFYIILALSSLLFAGYLGSGIYIILLVVIGLIIFKLISRSLS